MARRIAKSLSLILLIVIMYSCSPARPRISNEQEFSFREIIDVGEMNKVLRIDVQSGRQDGLEFGSDISVVINNLSNDEIFLPDNYGISMFTLKDNDWIEIQNRNEYYGDEFVLPPEGQNGFVGHVKTWVRPVLPAELKGEQGQEILRIVVIGELMSNGDKTGMLVGGYTDVFVSP